MSFFSKLSKTIAGKPHREASAPAPIAAFIPQEEELKLRRELVDLERRLAQKEEALENRTRSAEAKESEIVAKLAQIEKEKEEIEKIKQDQLARLQKVASLSVEEAKEKILEQGLKAKSGPDAEKAASESRKYISDASSGRVASATRR